MAATWTPLRVSLVHVIASSRHVTCVGVTSRHYVLIGLGDAIWDHNTPACVCPCLSTLPTSIRDTRVPFWATCQEGSLGGAPVSHHLSSPRAGASDARQDTGHPAQGSIGLQRLACTG